MDLKQIRYFVAIAEELNISRAARKLYVSQPSMSYFLTSLESDLGVKLFLRTPNSALTLTEAGHVYLEGCQKILAIQQDTRRRINEMKQESKEHFSFGFAGVQNSLILSRFIDVFFKLHPELNIDIVERGTYGLMQMVIDGELDMAYAAYDPQDLQKSLNYIPLGDMPMHLIVPLDHPLTNEREIAGRRTIKLSEVAGEPMVLLKSDTVQRKVLDHYFEQIGFKPTIQVETHSTYSTLSYVESGAAIGIGPQVSQSDKVVFLALDPPVTYQIGLYYNRKWGLSSIQEDCIKVMRDILKDMTPA